MAIMHLVRWDGKCIVADCKVQLAITDLFQVYDDREEWHCPECECAFSVHTIHDNLLVEK